MNDEYVKKLEKRNEELEAANRFFSSIIGVNIIRNIKDDIFKLLKLV
jgi:ppGpp synthetase/RelA/SpoT-type nucleotidyltranferase